MSVAELAALPPARKAEVQASLRQAREWLAEADQKFEAALAHSYGDRVRSNLREAGRDFGTTHFVDGNVRVTAEQGKRVKWDQQKLHQLSERIVASGELASHYIDAKLSVSETKFRSWPLALAQQFADARTVEPAKLSITLAPLAEGHA